MSGVLTCALPILQAGARLAREAAALIGRDHFTLANAFGQTDGLVDDETQRRTREIDFLVAAVDGDLARAGLDPHAGDGVLAAAGRISAALLVDDLLAERRGRSRGSGGAFEGAAEILEIELGRAHV